MVRLCRVRHWQVCVARRLTHDQLWSHKANGSIRVVCRVTPSPAAVVPPPGGAASTAVRQKGGPSVESDSESGEVMLRERGTHRRFQFDRVFDAATPVGASLSEVDALVRRRG